jgi:catalase
MTHQRSLVGARLRSAGLRIGADYAQLSVNAAKSEVNSYSRDGGMRSNNPADPVYAPNSYCGPHADPVLANETASTYGAEDEVIRSAYKPHAEDDDFGQPRTMVREVLNDEQRERLANNIIGHASNAVSEPVLERVFQYWRNVDKNLGDKVAGAFRK